MQADVGIQGLLNQELFRLKAKLGYGGHLQVMWKPNSNQMEVRGEVKGNTIFVYDTAEEEAVETLKHEFLEAILTSEYLESRIFEAKSHRRADRLIDVLSGLI